jgi:hypothetical protein
VDNYQIHHHKSHCQDLNLLHQRYCLQQNFERLQQQLAQEKIIVINMNAITVIVILQEKIH